MKKVLAIATISVLNSGLVASAALPDVETYNFVRKKYTLLVRQTRDACVYYADPGFIVARRNQQGDIRQLITLKTSSPNGGTACNGVFEFQYADVNCGTNQITYTTAIGSPATWSTDRVSDPGIAKKICALPTVQFDTPTQNLPAK